MITDLVFSRLMYPAGLTEEARESYEAYIRKYALPAAEHLTDTEDMAALREFSARRLWSEEAPKRYNRIRVRTGQTGSLKFPYE